MENTELLQRLTAPIDVGNRVGNTNPINLFIMFAMIVLLGVFLPGWGWPLGVCLFFLALGWAGAVGPGNTKAFLNLLLIVGLLLFVLRALLTPGEAWFSIGPLTVTHEGFWFGLDFSLRVMAICSAVALFFQLVSRPRMTLALENLGASPQVSYVILASFQSIIDLGKNTRVVLDAQKARGIETEKGVGNRLKAFFPVLAPVFLVALTQTEERAIALDARAFNARTKKTSLLISAPVPLGEKILVGVVIAGTLILLIGNLAKWSLLN